MALRPSVAAYAFDEAEFDELVSRLRAGELERGRLATAPIPLTDFEVGRNALSPLPSDPGERQQLGDLGRSALREGRVAAVVLNGGMATRFGGGAKGAVPVLDGEPESFLGLKLGACAQLARSLSGTLPVVVMNSFATEADSRTHLEQIAWAGVEASSRHAFAQSILPRVSGDGTALSARPEFSSAPDTDIYTAPGHGDTLGRLRQSGVLAKLRAAGVEHILVSNVDNLGADVDPVVLGAHMQACQRGAELSVEVVARRDTDTGGCVAGVEGRAIIVEGFRLPAGVDMTPYPHFNTNTLWFSATALDRDFPLTWFPVRKRLMTAAGSEVEVVQFERLIGQASEFLDTAYLEVDRADRFLPVKTREDLRDLAPMMRARIDASRAHQPSN